jgi:hypothetical protein
MPSDVDQGVQAGGTGEPQSVESKIAKMAAAFDGTDGEPVQQQTDDETPDQGDEDEPQGTQTPVDEVEVEFENWRGKLPAKLKAEIDKGADYTRKTQELAERGRLFDTEQRIRHEQSAFQQAAQKEIDQFRQIETQLEQYRTVDLSQIDGETLSRMSMAAANLREERAKLKDAIEGKRGEFRQKLLGAWDDMTVKAREVITKSIPNWDKVAGQVAEHALNEGFPFEHITGFDRVTRERVGPGVVDPTFARTLYKAMQWDKLQAGKATNLGKATNAPPVTRPGATDTRSRQQVATQNFRKELRAAGSPTQKANLIGDNVARRLERLGR